ncbi:MAG: rod shape-determining protein [Bacillota bacterium]
MPLQFIRRHFARALGIDLGTANSLVYERQKGVIIQEPSVVAVHRISGELLAIGREAYKMVGRTPGDIVVMRPLKQGVIADFDITREMLKYLIKKASRGKPFLKPIAVVSIASQTTEVEKRAVQQAALGAGARDVFLLEEPIAAAIGMEIPVQEPEGHMVVDIGGGTTDIGVIALGGVVTGLSLRIGGDTLDEHIVRFIRRKYNLMIGERTAEELKIRIGQAVITENKTCPVRGRDQVSGLPKSVDISSEELVEAMEEPMSHIVGGIRATIEHTPPELLADIMHKQIFLTGGGALLANWDRKIFDEIGMEAKVSQTALQDVALGTGKVLESVALLKRVIVPLRKVQAKK